MDKKRILLVGSGSILSTALATLWKDTQELTVAYSGASPGAAIRALGVTTKALSEVLNEPAGYDVLVVISAYIPSGKADESLLHEVNVKLVETLLLKFSTAQVVYCSSISVYGPQDATPLTESSSLLPQQTYAISKLWGEHLVLGASNRNSVIRISSLVGKGMKPVTFIPRLIQQAREQKEITLFGDGMRLQNYVHAADLARMIDGSVQQAASGILLGVGARSYSNREVAEAVQQLIPGTGIRYTGVDTSKGYAFDASHSYAAYGYRPAHNLNTIINDLLA